MSIHFRDALTFAVALSSLSPRGTGAQEVGPYDVVILGGRVIDPETGFGLQYVPSTSEEEVFRLFELGARYGVPSHLHIRYLGPQQPINSVKAIHEVIATAAATGASAQVVHVNSTSPTDIDPVLDLLEGAAVNGVVVVDNGELMESVHPGRAIRDAPGGS